MVHCIEIALPDTTGTFIPNFPAIDNPQESNPSYYTDSTAPVRQTVSDEGHDPVFNQLKEKTTFVVNLSDRVIGCSRVLWKCDSPDAISPLQQGSVSDIDALAMQHHEQVGFISLLNERSAPSAGTGSQCNAPEPPA